MDTFHTDDMERNGLGSARTRPRRRSPKLVPRPWADVVTYTDKHRRLAERDGDRCFWCGFPFLDGEPDAERTIDHVVARSRGGVGATANSVLCCPECNNKKGDRPLLHWLVMLEVSGDRYPASVRKVHRFARRAEPDPVRPGLRPFRGAPERWAALAALDTATQPAEYTAS